MARGPITTRFLPPTAGAFSNAPSHMLNRNGVVADYTQNSVIRNGRLVNRPGLAETIPGQTVTGRPMGGIYYNDGTQRKTFIVTTTGAYAYNGTGWGNVAAVPLTGTAEDHVRFVVWPETGENHLIFVNGHNDNPQLYTGTGNIADLGGSPPQAVDICISGNRIILARPFDGVNEHQYRIQWCDFNNETSWSAANIVDLSDTPDPIVAARNLTRLSFAVLKEDTQIVGRFQSGRFPFSFEIQDYKPGPCSTAAVVLRDGRLYYMGRDASFYAFDGSRCEHIGEPIRAWVQRNVSFENIKRTFGTYLGRDRAIYWIFPPTGDVDCYYGVSYDVETGCFMPHVFRQRVSCGFDGAVIHTVTWDGLSGTWDTIADTYPTWDSFGSIAFPTSTIGQISGKIYSFGVVAKDDGLAPSARWRFGPLVPDGVNPSDRGRLQSYESAFRQSSFGQNVLVSVLPTDTLKTEDITAPTGLSDIVDISVITEVIKTDTDIAAEGYGDGTPEARYFGMEHRIDTEGDWEWLGAYLRLYPLKSD